VAKLKLRCERVLIRSLATLKLLAGEEMDSPLLRLMFLPGQWVIEPLKDLKALVGWGSSSLARLVILSEPRCESKAQWKAPEGRRRRNLR
jgi:hypothetical protein